MRTYIIHYFDPYTDKETTENWSSERQLLVAVNYLRKHGIDFVAYAVYDTELGLILKKVEP